MKITIDLSAEDFNLLRTNTMRWEARGWDDQPDRFETMPYGGYVSWSYQWAHWLPDTASMILAREYLRAQDVGLQVIVDTVGGDYVILTDYDSTR